MITAAILYALYLLVWPYIKGFDVRLFQNKEEAEAYRVEYLKRKRMIRGWVEVKPMALEAYDHMVVESLNGQYFEEEDKKTPWFYSFFTLDRWERSAQNREFTEVENMFINSGLQLEKERILNDLRWWTYRRNRSSGYKYEAAKRVCSRLRKGMLDSIGLEV